MNKYDEKWIGVDLDGTLALQNWGPNEFRIEEIGDPIIPMLNKVKEWIEQGIEVRIFTARANEAEKIPYIEKWLIKNGIGGLKITNIKSHGLIAFYDDRAIRVEKNTGKICNCFLSQNKG